MAASRIPGTGQGGRSPEVMASVEDTGPQSRLVIADISRDDAWVSVPVSATATLRDWR